MKKFWDKKNVPAIATSLGIATLFLAGFQLLGNHFTEAMGLITAIALGLVLSAMMILAGFAVLKSLAAVGAEISLLIFLAQSYCSANRSTESDQALNGLLILSLIFIAFTFAWSLYKILVEYYANVKDDPWSADKIISVSLFAIFIVLFFSQLSLVIGPIILDLCIYKS